MGPNHWSIRRGSAKINIAYHEKSGLIIGDAYLATLPEDNIKELYTFLLKQNYKLEGLTFSVKGQDIILSLLIYDQYLNKEVTEIRVVILPFVSLHSLDRPKDKGQITF